MTLPRLPSLDQWHLLALVKGLFLLWAWGVRGKKDHATGPSAAAGPQRAPAGRLGPQMPVRVAATSSEEEEAARGQAPRAWTLISDCTLAAVPAEETKKGLKTDPQGHSSGRLGPCWLLGHVPGPAHQPASRTALLQRWPRLQATSGLTTHSEAREGLSLTKTWASPPFPQSANSGGLKCSKKTQGSG